MRGLNAIVDMTFCKLLGKRPLWVLLNFQVLSPMAANSQGMSSLRRVIL